MDAFGSGLRMLPMIGGMLAGMIGGTRLQSPRGTVRERSGAGSALITAMRQVGATIGVAVLGTVLGSAYRSQLVLTGLPAAIAGAAKSSVAAGVTVAHQLGSASLLDSVRTAFVHGLDIMLWTCAGIAIVSAALALAFLPRRSVPASGSDAGSIPAGTGENGSQRARLGP